VDGGVTDRRVVELLAGGMIFGILVANDWMVVGPLIDRGEDGRINLGVVGRGDGSSDLGEINGSVDGFVGGEEDEEEVAVISDGCKLEFSSLHDSLTESL